MKKIITTIYTLLFSATFLSARTIEVTSNADSGTGTLRQVVVDADNGDIIVFADNVTTVYFAGVIIIDKNITISGNEENYTEFRNATTWTDTQNKKRYFHILENVEVTFNYLSLRLNTANCSGGALINYGNLTLNNCSFDRNIAYDVGGAIYNSSGGILSVNHCNFPGGNSAPQGGSAIMNYGQISITNSTFENNHDASAIRLLSSADNYITNCTFNAHSNARGLIENSSNLVIDNCTFSEVSPGMWGIISNSQMDLSVYSMIVSGTLVSASLRESNLLIANCIFSKNNNQNYQNLVTNCFGANMIIVNCIFTENKTGLPIPYDNYNYYPEWRHHGVISNLNLVGYRYELSGSSKMTIINSTIADNTGIGVYSNGDINMYNSIICNNTPKYETSLPERYNLYATGFWDRQDFSNNLIGENPLFVGGGDYSLQAESPAIDKGNNAYLTDFPSFENLESLTDLAGNPRISNNTIDLGAYEYQQNVTSIKNPVSADTAKTIIGYINILGQKLPKAPESGIFIILYDNGTTEKMMKE